jgi:hypothetical protein
LIFSIKEIDSNLINLSSLRFSSTSKQTGNPKHQSRERFNRKSIHPSIPS